MSIVSANRCVIESIDGLGKSTAAKGSAENLSGAYPDQIISVVDSTGVYRYRAGELTEHKWSRIESLEPHQSKSKPVIAARLGAFTLARRMAEAWAVQRSDLVIAARDPFRIDPATYSLIFGPDLMSHLSSESRLRLFDRFTLSRHPDLIVSLSSDPSSRQIDSSYNGLPDAHETDENLELLAAELPLVLSGYQRLYGTPVVDIDAMQPDTVDRVTAQIEGIVPVSLTTVQIPSYPPVAG